MIRIVAWLPLFLVVSTPVWAARVDVTDPAVFGPVVAETGDFWFSEVRFDGQLYTYTYGFLFYNTTCDCPPDMDPTSGQPVLLQGHVIGGQLDGNWGNLPNSEGNLVLTLSPAPDGLLFTTQNHGPLRFYVQNPHAPVFSGQLVGDFMYTNWVLHPDGSIVEDERGLPITRTVFYSQEADVFVPTPEPGSFLLCGIGMAAAYARYRSRRSPK